ncbi:MAG TPA: class I poly(R)-hydroxyalkanoic acid synthase [Casimicrobiaceae bacterium]|nr:class I poly(R)-hydroxyalkanoic acid synthase [Casimicrobiaceae bacterium]
MTSHPAHNADPMADLGKHWQTALADWTRWWTGAAGSASAASVGNPSTEAMAAAMGLPQGEAIAALNDKYRKRWEKLWVAAADSLAQPPGSAQRMPVVAEPAQGDRRFAAPEWDEIPYFALMKQGYLLAAEYLKELAASTALAESDRKRLVFATKQFVDALAPSNFVATNPVVLKRALATEGASLVQGFANLAADAQRGRISMSDAAAFAVGRNLAVTPGSVVFRNELIELIQYAPSTSRVYRRPLLVVPPCINKYYILDLQPENSFARWAVAEGHTVFIISWRNIPPELGHLTWDDYLVDGILAALEAAKEVADSKTINTLGFCVGGTLLACALAVLAARGDRSVESVTLLTTMLDFAHPGDIGVYVSRETLAAREPGLIAGQRMRGSELASAFASLRANELVWTYVVNNYLKGETPPAFDLLYWNGDSANLPGPMYVYYVRNMYLDNRLREPGALTMAGESIDLGRIEVPAYIIASREDHIVPWRSAYRTTRLLGGETTFVLAASGHIAGIVNPPAQNRRNYWTNPLVAARSGEWFERAASHPGSWWPHWGAWLAPHGGAVHRGQRTQGSSRLPPLEPAPGRYVLEKSE